MAAYWKSPYKESTLANNGLDIHRTEPVPAFQSLPSAKQVETVHPISPQDWFDSALPTNTPQPKPHTPQIRQNSGRIKGILKTQDDSDMSDAGRASQISESPFSATSDISVLKREKKKVQFVVSDAINRDDYVALGPRFQSDRSTSAYRQRMNRTQFLDEFSRDNLKKLLNRAPAFSALPSVSGKCIVSRKSNSRPVSYSDKCRHSPDLRCANCLQDNANKGKILTKSSENDSITGTGDQEADRFSSTERKDNEERNSKTESSRRYQRYWTQSGGRLQLRKKWVPHRNDNGPISFSAGTLHKRLSRNQSPATQTRPGMVFEEFERLHINGDRKKIETKLNGLSAQGNSDGSNGVEAIRGQESKDIGGNLGMLESLLQSGNRTRARRDYNNNTNSAPSRLKSQKVPNIYGVSVSGRDMEVEKCLDKTSQILTWLKDVREKENYKPRNARLYALEPQQYH